MSASRLRRPARRRRRLRARRRRRLPGYDHRHQSRSPARLVRGLIIVPVTVIPASSSLIAGPTEIEPCSVDSLRQHHRRGGRSTRCAKDPPTAPGRSPRLMAVTALVGGVYYFAKLEGDRGQTVGKKALGIRVIDATTGGPIGVGRGIGRYFARIISGIPFYLGYLWAIWDRRSRPGTTRWSTTSSSRTERRGGGAHHRRRRRGGHPRRRRGAHLPGPRARHRPRARGLRVPHAAAPRRAARHRRHRQRRALRRDDVRDHGRDPGRPVLQRRPRAPSPTPS